jgi:hypothetical protein
MVLEVTEFIWQQEGIWHEFIVNGKETLEATDDHTENVFLSKVVHQRVPVENTLGHFYYVEVMVSQSHPVP